MDADAGTPRTQPSVRRVPTVLRRRILTRNWLVSCLVVLFAILVVIHITSLRRRPRPKATSVWDSGGKVRLGAPQPADVSTAYASTNASTTAEVSDAELSSFEVRSNLVIVVANHLNLASRAV